MVWKIRNVHNNHRDLSKGLRERGENSGGNYSNSRIPYVNNNNNNNNIVINSVRKLDNVVSFVLYGENKMDFFHF